MADLRLVRVPLPYAGQNKNAAPGTAPEGKGPIVRNFLPHFPGKMVLRGPFIPSTSKINVAFTAAYSSEKLIPVGTWVHNDKVLLQFAEKGGGFIPPWKVPYMRPSSSGELDTPRAIVTRVDTSVPGGGVSSIGVSTTQSLCGKSARIEASSYGFSYAGTETFTSDSVIQYVRPLLKWSGENKAPEVYKEAPHSGQYVKAHLNRLWVLGGCDPSSTKFVKINKATTVSTGANIINFSGMTSEELFALFTAGSEIETNEYFATGTKVTAVFFTEGVAEVVINKLPIKPAVGLTNIVAVKKLNTATYEANTLFFSDQGGPTTDVIDRWKDDVSGLVNKIIVGDEDRNDFGVALAVVNQTLLIFKRNSVWARYGYSASTFQVRNLTFEFGCIDPWSVCETHYGVYFMSQNGLMYFDGETFKQVDDEQDAYTQPLVFLSAGDKADQNPEKYFGRVSVDDIGGGYLMMTVNRQWNKEEGANKHGDMVANPYVAIMHHETKNWAEFTSDVFAEKTGVAVLGKVNAIPFIFPVEGRLFDIAGITEVNAGEQRDRISATKGIPALLRTDRVELNSPGYMSQFQRIMLDYTWPNGASDGAASKGWWVGVKDGDGSTILSQTQVAGQATESIEGGAPATAYMRGRRFEVDNFEEAIDGHFEIEAKSSETVNVRNPELYAATFEVQLTRKRRST